mgnify:CR=1 FL=1
MSFTHFLRTNNQQNPTYNQQNPVISEAKRFTAGLAIVFSFGLACYSDKILSWINANNNHKPISDRKVICYTETAQYERDLTLGEQIGRNVLRTVVKTLTVICALGLVWLYCRRDLGPVQRLSHEP